MKRMKNRKGFTLVEMLLTVMIMIFLGIILTTSISLALKSYNKMMFHSNSQLLSDDVNTAIQGLTNTSDAISVKSGNVCFRSNIYAATQSYGYVKLEDGKLKVEPLSAGAASKDVDTSSMLVNYGAYTNLEISNWSMTYSNGLCSGGYTISNTYGSRDFTYSFRAVND